MRKILFNLMAAQASLLLARDAFASGGESGPGFFFVLVNFAIFIALLPVVLRVLFGVNLFTVFKDRGEKLSGDVRDADGEKQGAMTTFDEISSRLSEIAESLNKMAVDSKSMGDKLKEEIISMAKSRAEMAIDDGKLMAERETELAKEFLKRGLLELSAQMTEKKIQDKLDKKGHSSLIDGCIKQLEGI